MGGLDESWVPGVALETISPFLLLFLLLLNSNLYYQIHASLTSTKIFIHFTAL
jgi:hypothetical protein